MKTLVLGATGYTGMLLLRILAAHRDVSSITAASSSIDGSPIRDNDTGLAPHLLNRIEERYISIREAQKRSFDVVFSALPHGASAEVWAPFIGKSVIIDLSADFRYVDLDTFQRAYNQQAPLQEHQDGSVYGLVEWARDAISASDIIANPGCYPTATLLPLLPLVTAGLIQGPIFTAAMSGISGAGRKANTNLLLAERAENVNAYNPGHHHRHASEISEQLALRGNTFDFVFTPHLVPIKQGMAVTTTVTVSDAEAALQALRERYRDEPFVRVLESAQPQTRHVRGTNRIDIAAIPSGDHLVVMSALDNLWKGASGQAVQNMNVRFGLEETTGLLYPGDL